LFLVPSPDTERSSCFPALTLGRPE
jgi:hypothetical protein